MLEFYVSPEGDVHIVEGIKDYILTQRCKELISSIDSFMQKYCKEAWTRCRSFAKNNSKFKDQRDVTYKAVARFVRCNCGVRDNADTDYNGHQFFFEEVPCPLRGICRDEGVICKPRLTILAKRMKDDIRLMTEGYEPKQIAEMTGRAKTRVCHSLSAAREKLGLDNNYQLLRFCRSFNLK